MIWIISTWAIIGAQVANIVWYVSSVPHVNWLVALFAVVMLVWIVYSGTNFISTVNRERQR